MMRLFVQTQTWKARWRHVSQLGQHPGDAPGAQEGANDCFEASLSRYLRETGYPFSGDDMALIGAMRLLATGQADRAGQGFTSLEQASACLTALGIGWRWTTSLDEARAATWALCWVRAAWLRLATVASTPDGVSWTAYPGSWTGAPHTYPDHFILWLPDGRFNDPLAWWVDDCFYSDTSLAGAFGGAYIITSPPAAAVAATAAPGPGSAMTGRGLRVNSPGGLHLREAPTGQAPVLATIPDGTALHDCYADECTWRFVHYEAFHGWVRRDLTRGG